MSQLLTLQFKMTKDLAQLINFASSLGLQLTLGDAYRDPRLFGEVGVKRGYSHPKSLHKLRLAVDLNLFRDDKLLNVAEYQPLGEFWESLGNTWGGRFDDANHFSIEYQGMR